MFSELKFFSSSRVRLLQKSEGAVEDEKREIFSPFLWSLSPLLRELILVRSCLSILLSALLHGTAHYPHLSLRFQFLLIRNRNEYWVLENLFHHQYCSYD